MLKNALLLLIITYSTWGESNLTIELLRAFLRKRKFYNKTFLQI